MEINKNNFATGTAILYLLFLFSSIPLSIYFEIKADKDKPKVI